MHNVQQRERHGVCGSYCLDGRVHELTHYNGCAQFAQRTSASKIRHPYENFRPEEYESGSYI